MTLAERAAALLGEDGAFVRAGAGFSPRAGQIRLTREIGDAIGAREHLVAEAGTGTGKTLAYLVPILECRERAIISTATRTLQEQIYQHDLPYVARVLGRARSVAVLKGRDNYLCRQRWKQHREDWVGFGNAGLDDAALGAWVRSTASGDFAELPAGADTAVLRRGLTASAEACLGVDCPQYSRCHVYAARARAKAAEVVIVNHHLLLADMRLKQSGAEGLLGAAGVVVVDEAHALPEIARSMLGESLSSAQLRELSEDAGRKLGGDAGVRKAALALFEATRFRGLPGGSGKHVWQEVAGPLRADLEHLRAALDELEASVSALPDSEMLRGRIRACLGRLDALTGEQSADASGFRWLETAKRGTFSFHSSPIEPGAALEDWIEDSGASWIMTSASLAVDGNFESFVRQVGLGEHRSVLEGSPFDFRRQALLYLPPGMRAANRRNREDYTDAVLGAAMPLLEAATGGAFLLFTSHRALRRATRLLRDCPLGRELFVQGEHPQGHLLEAFRQSGTGILCGTASFWKGVDVKGSALELVVIDRLPFGWPGDPLFKARLEHCAASGGAPFPDIQLPEAVLALKQGAGRLIRDAADRGVLMICDPRLQTAPYRGRFLDGLPPMRCTRNGAQAAAFLCGERTRERARV